MHHRDFLIVQYGKNLGPAIIKTEVNTTRAITNCLSNCTTYHILNTEMVKTHELQIHERS